MSSGETVTGGAVMSSAAVTPRAFSSCLCRRMPVIMPGMWSSPPPRAILFSRSDSETTPITRLSSSSTGNALTRYCRSAAAIAANGVSRSTQVTWVVITSLTARFIVRTPSQRVSTTFSAPLVAASPKTS